MGVGGGGGNPVTFVHHTIAVDGYLSQFLR